MENTDPKADPTIVHLLKTQDELVELFRRNMAYLAEYIQEYGIVRDTVVQSIVKARDIGYVTAQSQYSRAKRTLNDPEILAMLQDKNVPLSLTLGLPRTRKENSRKKSK